jgi:transcriptional regulator with XRE-family HTH domain
LEVVLAKKLNISAFLLELAEAADISESTVRNYYNGDVTPRPTRARVLEGLTGVKRIFWSFPEYGDPWQKWRMKGFQILPVHNQDSAGQAPGEV